MTIEAEIIDLTHQGEGIAKVDGKVYFIAGALPGERITFTPERKRKGKFPGKLEQVLQPSPHRVEPVCEFFAACGGCNLQHLSSKQQLLYKEKMLFDNLERIGRVQPQARLKPLTGPTSGYRRKARPGIRHVAKKDKVLVGFREKASHFITDMDRCETLAPQLSLLLKPLGELIATFSIKDQLPQVEMALSDNKVMLILRHLAPFSDAEREALIDFAKAYDLILMLQSKGPASVVSLYPDDMPVFEYGVEVNDRAIGFQFRADDFIQVNRVVNEKMLAQAMDLLALSETDRVLDLFCGLGNFSLPIASQCQHVHGVEGDQYLIDKARINAQYNQLTNATFQRADLYESEQLALEQFAFADFNKVLLDPPRSGAKIVVEQMFEQFQPERIVYVSCNPSTLARDAGVLVEKYGYTLEAAGVIDMFPHTAHVEAMALFTR